MILYEENRSADSGAVSQGGTGKCRRISGRQSEAFSLVQCSINVDNVPVLIAYDESVLANQACFARTDSILHVQPGKKVLGLAVYVYRDEMIRDSTLEEGASNAPS